MDSHNKNQELRAPNQQNSQTVPDQLNKEKRKKQGWQNQTCISRALRG